MEHNERIHRPLDEVMLCHTCFRSSSVGEIVTDSDRLYFREAEPLNPESQDSDTALCPSCQTELPYESLLSAHADARICLVGPKGTGKSHFMSWLRLMLHTGVKTDDGVSIAGDLWAAQLDDWKGYFNSHDPRTSSTDADLVATPNEIRPAWIFPLTIRRNGELRKRVLLQVLDLGGEQYTRKQPFVEVADGLVFMARPEAVKKGLKDEDVELTAETRKVFNIQKDTWQGNVGGRTVSFVLTKSDTYDRSDVPRALVETAFPMSYAPGSRALSLKSIGESIFAEARELEGWLARSGCTPYQDIVDWLSPLGGEEALILTAVGGLGYSDQPDDPRSDVRLPANAVIQGVQDGGDSPEVGPERCLVPILWTLSRLGILEDE